MSAAWVIMWQIEEMLVFEEIDPNRSAELEIHKTIIPVSLSDTAQKVITYAFLISKDILCDHTIFHCLENGTTEEEARKQLNTFLEIALQRFPPLPQSTIKILIVSGNLIDELQKLQAREKYNTMAIGTGSKPAEWEMGTTARDIVMQVPVRILAVPPAADMVFPGGLGVMVEKIDVSYANVFTIFLEYVEHYNLFLSFVLFAKDRQTLEEERKLIEGFKDFFNETISFSFILEEEQTVLNFLKYADELSCDGSVIAWDEGTTAYKAAKESGRVFCNPNKPILYLNRAKLKDNIEHLVFADEIEA